LCTFKEQFSKVTLNIKNLNLEVGLTSYGHNAQAMCFVDDLCLTLDDSLDELRQHASKFMKLKELREFRNKVRVETMPVENKPSDRDNGNKGAFRHRSLNLLDFRVIPLLMPPRSHMLDEAL